MRGIRSVGGYVTPEVADDVLIDLLRGALGIFGHF